MESLEKINSFCSSPLVTFLNMDHAFTHRDKKWKDISAILCV